MIRPLAVAIALAGLAAPAAAVETLSLAAAVTNDPAKIGGAEFANLPERFGNRPTAVPGVPEPGTWAMLIAGFGLVGAMVRRRRLRVA